MAGEMREALENMLAHRVRSTAVDRTGWTRQQWIDDARRLMDELDGSVQSLLNGHVLALLDALVDAEERAKWAIEKGIAFRNRAEKAEAEVEQPRAERRDARQ